MSEQGGFLPVNPLDLILPTRAGQVHGGEPGAFLAACERFQALQAVRLAEIEQMPLPQALLALETLTEDVSAMCAAEEVRDA